MMDRGFYLPCSQFEAAFNSVLHTEERLAQTARRGPRGAARGVSHIARYPQR